VLGGAGKGGRTFVAAPPPSAARQAFKRRLASAGEAGAIFIGGGEASEGASTAPSEEDGGRSPLRGLSRGKRRGGRQRQDGTGRLHGLRIDDLELALGNLEDAGEGALVLPGHRIPRRPEVHAVALHRAALGAVGLA